MLCRKCSKEIALVDGKIGFRDECPHCGEDLHSCMNCGFFDRSAYNECRETQADRVLEKDRANFCEYFKISDGSGKAGVSPADDAKRKLEELFKKK